MVFWSRFGHIFLFRGTTVARCVIVLSFNIGLCGTLTSRKKKKGFFRSKANTEHDKAELALYEEVTLMKPFRRKTLILIGASGSSRRALKHRIINGDPDQVRVIHNRTLVRISEVRVQIFIIAIQNTDD